jgi:hypothetical protein
MVCRFMDSADEESPETAWRWKAILWLQRIWYSEALSAFPRFLRPFFGIASCCYGRALRRKQRNLRMRQRKLPFPFFVWAILLRAAQAKTPITLWLAHWLERKGWNPPY